MIRLLEAICQCGPSRPLAPSRTRKIMQLLSLPIFPHRFRHSFAALSISAVIFLIAAGSLHAETIYMRNGKVIQAKIVNQTKTTIEIENESGRRTIQKRFIKRIQYPGQEDRQEEIELRRLEEEKRKEQERKAEEERRRKEEQEREKREQQVAQQKKQEEEQQKLKEKEEEEKRKQEEEKLSAAHEKKREAWMSKRFWLDAAIGGGKSKRDLPGIKTYSNYYTFNNLIPDSKIINKVPLKWENTPTATDYSIQLDAIYRRFSAAASFDSYSSTSSLQTLEFYTNTDCNGSTCNVAEYTNIAMKNTREKQFLLKAGFSPFLLKWMDVRLYLHYTNYSYSTILSISRFYSATDLTTLATSQTPILVPDGKTEFQNSGFYPGIRLQFQIPFRLEVTLFYEPFNQKGTYSLHVYDTHLQSSTNTTDYSQVFIDGELRSKGSRGGISFRYPIYRNFFLQLDGAYSRTRTEITSLKMQPLISFSSTSISLSTNDQGQVSLEPYIVAKTDLMKSNFTFIANSSTVRLMLGYRFDFSGKKPEE